MRVSDSARPSPAQHGYGTYVLAKGGKYEGEWENGTRHGTGTYYYPDGVRVYRGEWKHNVRNAAL